jgi:hypothetical protein
MRVCSAAGFTIETLGVGIRENFPQEFPRTNLQRDQGCSAIVTRLQTKEM